MTKLSVNINKFATLRNARGGNRPNIIQTAIDCERFGAQGITVHPRPDQRHIRYADVFELKQVITTEFNIEGNPNRDFVDLVLQVKPTQVTLVPDAPEVLTSNAGWDTIVNKMFLTEIISEFKSNGIRTSIFIDPESKYFESAAETGTDRVELYTESFAKLYLKDKVEAIKDYVVVGKVAGELGLGLNAGHDLDLDNLKYFTKKVPKVLEVSIGHALVCDALYLGLEKTIGLYIRQLQIN